MHAYVQYDLLEFYKRVIKIKIFSLCEITHSRHSISLIKSSFALRRIQRAGSAGCLRGKRIRLEFAA